MKILSEGIDVSYHNGKIDWEKVKLSGKTFAFIRLGYSGYEGELHIDKNFYENIRCAEKEGLKTGAYVYSYNKNEKSARKTAEEITVALNKIKLSFPVAFDVEETGHSIFTSRKRDENSSLCLAFFDELSKRGLKGMLYTYTNFAKNYLNMNMLKGFDLWIADYRDESGEKCPYDGEFAIWQYKGQNGRCDGVSGPCDLNFCFKDFEKNTDYRKKYENIKYALDKILKEY